MEKACFISTMLQKQIVKMEAHHYIIPEFKYTEQLISHHPCICHIKDDIKCVHFSMWSFRIHKYSVIYICSMHISCGVQVMERIQHNTKSNAPLLGHDMSY